MSSIPDDTINVFRYSHCKCRSYKLGLYIWKSLGIENSIDEISIGIDSIELSSRNLIL